MAKEAAAQITAALDRVPGLARRLESARIKPGSPAALDAAHPPIGRLPWNHGLDGCSGASDHLATWRSLWSEEKPHRIHVHSHYTLLRAAAEGAVQARWVCDPKLEPAERRQRAIDLQCDSELQRHRLEHVGLSEGYRPPPGIGGKSGIYRLAELRRDARRVGVNKARPLNLTRMFREYAQFGPTAGAGEFLYRLLSALSHGKEWARISISTREVLERDPATGSRRLLATASLPTAGWTTEIVVRLAERAFDDLERYGGIGPAT